uniref:Uncharacterized protein n=1 Tax=Eutreptiella gymnastica TaxID=73025 RepID=A0A7S4FXN4_9EUGL
MAVAHPGRMVQWPRLCHVLGYGGFVGPCAALQSTAPQATASRDPAVGAGAPQEVPFGHGPACGGLSHVKYETIRRTAACALGPGPQTQGSLRRYRTLCRWVKWAPLLTSLCKGD